MVGPELPLKLRLNGEAPIAFAGRKCASVLRSLWFLANCVILIRVEVCRRLQFVLDLHGADEGGSPQKSADSE